MRLAQEPSLKLLNFRAGLRRAGAGIATAAQLAGANITPLSIAGAALTAGADRGAAAITLASQLQASMELGAQMARNDLVRQVQFNLTKGDGSAISLAGTAAPYGSMYSAISLHALQNVLGNNPGYTNFSMSIGIGASVSERTQLINVSSWLAHPTEDFLLLTHSQPVAGADVPEIGTVARNNIVTFAGYGDRYVFGQASVIDYRGAGYPSGWNMRVSNTSDPSNYGLTSTSVPGIAGAGTNGDSIGPGYLDGKLVLFLDNAFFDPIVGIAGNGAIPAVRVKDFLEANTPLNNIPEPSVPFMLGLGAAAAALKRKRTS
jgi:hypothetical protein